MKTTKFILIALILALATATANAQKISAMTKVSYVWPSAHIELSHTNGGGSGWITRSIALSNIFNTPSLDGIFNMGDYVTLQTTNSNPARISFSSTVHGTTRGVVQVGSGSGDVVLNPSTSGVLQIGQTGNAGTDHYMQYATFPSPSFPFGFSHPLEFRARATNTSTASSFLYAKPGIVGFAADTNATPLGELRFYTQSPKWNFGNLDPNSPNTAGIEVARMRTNGFTFTGTTTNVGPFIVTAAQTNLGSLVVNGAQTNLAGIRTATESFFTGGIHVEGAAKVLIGGRNFSPGAAGLDINYGAYDAMCLGGDFTIAGRTTGAEKYHGTVLAPKNNSDPVILLNLYQTSGSGAYIYYGGGTGVRAPVTRHSFYAHTASTANNAGTEEIRITSLTTDVKSPNFIVSAPTVPASAAAAGTAGSIAWDASYVYICTAANTWKRAAIATW